MTALPDPIAVYVSVGNSDDKLTQRQWHDFVVDVLDAVDMAADTVHGEWYSNPDSQWQNMTVCFEVTPGAVVTGLQTRLAQIAHKYGQDSVAWAKAETVFIKAVTE